MKKVIPIFVIIISLFTVSYAHSGRTDGYGGHYNRSTGTYHYHSGEYAYTGEYTAPIEEGGHLIDDEDENYTVVVDSPADTITSNNTNTTSSNTSELEKRIISKDKSIQNLKNVVVDREGKIKDLENEKTNLWWTFGFVFFIGIYIAYQVGKNKDIDIKYQKLSKIVMNGIDEKDIDKAIEKTSEFYKEQGKYIDN